MMTINSVPVPPCRRSDANVFNVLLLGETQVGKSNFAQAVKQYANPNHVIEKDTIGNGNTSKTKNVHRYCVNTQYPEYEVLLETQSKDGASYTSINVDAILDENKADWEDYEDALNNRKTKLRMRDGSGKQEIHHIHLFDTPGLNNTNGQDEVHIASIIKSLQTAGSIHLVLVIVGNSPFTPGFQSALECYMEVFPEFQGVIAFVHTKFDYVNLHPLRRDKISGMEERKRKLYEIMGRPHYKHFVIDCDFEVIKPIRRCITQNTIREILMEAKTNLPVSVETETVCKTPKMKAIDGIVINKYNAILIATTETMNSEQSAAMSRIVQLDTRLNRIQATESEMSDYIYTHNTTEYIFIDERSFDQPWSIVDLDRHHSMSLPSQEYTIYRVHISQQHTYIKRTIGGEGDKFWGIEFTRKAYKHGVLRAKFYTTSAEKFRHQIEDAWKKLNAAQRDYPGAIEDLKEFMADKKRLFQEIGVLRQRNKLATDMIAKAREPLMKLAQFEALVAIGTYFKGDAEVVEMIEARYLAVVSKE
ncbi:MAG: hypothetical protein J3R72DRAFT_448090 [Linnemannia gamsii]|nr:MAG: hypothetical protein J3R72DRAFT_448090 [Linnemannia gamsii]